MIRLQLRRLTLAVLVTLLAFGASPAAGAESGATITFFGGGYGHGIGMSQYGALGRAQAGHTHDQILDFYYPGTDLSSVDEFGSFGADDDVDVLIEVRSEVAISRPFIDGAPQEGWKVEVRADGELLGTVTSSVSAVYANGTWSATAGGEQLCDARCDGAVLKFAHTGGTHVVLEQYEDGPNLGHTINGVAPGAFANGRIVLYPGALGGGCGSATQFCVIHGDLDLQDYLYGISEIPTSWHPEAQKAQAIAARSYAASAMMRRQGNGKAYDLVNGVADQYYLGHQKVLVGCGNWCDAVDATNNTVVTYGGAIAETYYSASNGGATAEPHHVWSAGTPLPYLKAKDDPFDGNAANPYRPREVVYSVDDVSRWLNDYHLSYPSTGDQLQVGTVRNITIDDVPASGRITFAEVTIVGTKKTVTVYQDPDGPGDDPYGERFYNALKRGCQATPGCDPLVSSNFEIRRVLPFTDVGFGDYFYAPVEWMTLEGLTKGVSATEFGPDRSNTRAQMATFVWRFAGEPAAGAAHGFSDVVTDSFYDDAVAWMKAQGITTGTTASTFSPDGTVTRAQAAAFLWRFAGSPSSSASFDFVDVPDGAYYTEAVRWMVEWDITTGTTATTYSPNDVLTRGQIATFLWRLAGAPEAFADGVSLPPSMRTGD